VTHRVSVELTAPRRRVPPAVARLWASPSRGVTSTLVLTQAATALGAVVVNLVSARVLGPSGRGQLALLLQLAYLAGSLAIVGTDRPYIATHKATFGRAVSDQLHILRPMVWVSGLAVGAALLVAAVLPGHGSFLVLAAILMGAGNFAYRLAVTAYIASGRTALFAWLTVSMQVILLIGAVIAYTASVRSVSLWLALYAASTLPSAVLMLRHARNASGPPLEDAEVRSLRAAGLRLLPASLGNTTMLRSDRLLLPALSSTRELGIYVVVASIMELTAWPVKNYVDATLWRWRQRADTLSVGRVALGAALATAAISAVVGAAAILMITEFLGPAYRSSIPLVLPLGIASVFYAVSRVLQGALVAKSAGGYASAAEISGMVISVLAYVALIPGYGAGGAAVGSAIGYGGCCLVTAALLRSANRRAGAGTPVEGLGVEGSPA
jgi:O-antigen/teichoic acid export membrane protein